MSLRYRPFGPVPCVMLALTTAFTFAASFSTLASAVTKEPTTLRAAAVVNDTIISTYDLEQRVKLVMVTSGSQGPEAAKRLRPQVLRQLIDELLQLQEAQKYKVTITAEELDKSFKRIAQSNNITVEQIYKMLDENSISRSTLQQQIKADLAWQKLIQGRLSSRVSVSDDEVDTAFIQAQEASKKTQYLVAEIFLAVDTPSAEDQVKQSVQGILNQVRSGANFPGLARQFSQSSTASNGGDLGWVTELDLPDTLAKAVKSMAPGSVSEPLRAPGGYYILALRQKRLAAGTSVKAEAAPKPQAEQKMKPVISLGRVSIPVPAGASKSTEEKIRQLSIELFRSIDGCSSASSIVRSRGAKFEMLGQLTVKDLAPQFAGILQKTPNGRSTPPLRGAQGVEMFVICSGGMVPAATANTEAPVKAAEIVTKEEIENRLINQEMSMLARRYLRDLRRDATIEMKDN